MSYPYARRAGLALALLFFAAPWAAAQTTFFVCPDGPPSCLYGSIQDAVDAADDGDTIQLTPGTYEEQVTVDGKQLTIRGTSVSTSTIMAPETLAACFATGGGDIKPVVCAINSAELTLENLTLDGAGRGNGNVRFAGVAYRNSGGAVEGTAITGIRETPLNGVQHGTAVYSFNDDGQSRTISVQDNEIDDFQKNGMALNAANTTPLVVDVQGNIVTGAGPTPEIGQNGIQVFGAQITGTIADNAVSDIAYTGPFFVATSILNYYATVDATGNTVSGAQTGLYWFDGAGTLSGNTVGVVPAGDYSFGIIGSDPPRARPSPYDPPAEGAARRTSGGAGAMALLTVSVEGNTVTFSGGDNSAAFGIEADGGYSDNDLAFSVSGNTVSGFGVGVEIFQCPSGCATGTFASVSVTGNNLDGNTLAIESSWSGTVDAPGNYYGDDDPSDDVAGNVDYSPWLGFPVGTSPQTVYTNDSIQDAVDLADSGDDVIVLPGTYVEQVTVDGKSLDITGAGADDTRIQAPDAPTVLADCFGVSQAVVCARNSAELTLDGFTVDGNGRGNGNDLMGVVLFLSGGTIRNNTVEAVRSTPADGVQSGLAIFADNFDDGTYTVAVEDNLVRDFQKNGITVGGAGVTFTVSGNTVEGYGPVPFIAQNGIQIAFGAEGSVSGNTVSGLSYDPTPENEVNDFFDAAGVLLFFVSGVTVENNAVTGSESGILASDASAVIRDNTVTTSEAASGDDDYIGVYVDSFGGTPGLVAEEMASGKTLAAGRRLPALAGASARSHDRKAAGSEGAGRLAGTVAYSLTGNGITGGTDDHGTGLFAYAFANDGTQLSLAADSNDVGGFATGVYVCEDAPGLVQDVDLDGHNDLSGNNPLALFTCIANEIDAENNFWGRFTREGIAALIDGPGEENVDFIPFKATFDLMATATSPLTVPRGGQVSFQYTVTNTTPTPVTGDLYYVVERDGNPVLQGAIRSGTVPGNQTVGGSFTQQVPQGTPVGEYEYRLRIGSFPTFVADEETFAVTVTGAALAARDTPERDEAAPSAWPVVEAAPWVVLAETAAAETAADAAATPEAAAAQAEAPASLAVAALPTELGVLMAPNPAAGRATLTVAVPAAATVRVAVYDVTGREVAVVADGPLEAGRHALALDASALAPGLYVVRVQSGSEVAVRRVVVAR